MAKTYFMQNGLRVHQFSGFTADDVLRRIGGTEKYLEQYEAFESGPFKTSRTQGIIAAYIACNPGITASALAAFCYWNNIPLDYDINLDTDDQQDPRTIGGMINFLYDFPNLNGFQENFNKWAAGYEVAELPGLPAQAQPVYEEPEFLPSQPAPQPAYQAPSAASPQPLQPLAPSPQPAPTSTTNFAPAPQPAIATQPAPAATPAAAAPSSQAVPKKSEPQIPWMMILIGVAIIFFLMNKKKGKR